MNWRSSFGTVLFASFVLAALTVVPASHAGLTDKFKKKVEDKVTKATEQAVDQPKTEA